MAENEVSFRITADTKPAVHAIKDIQSALKDIKPIKSVDKGVVKQQNELLRVSDAVNKVLAENENHWKLYDANVTRVKNLTAALDEQQKKLDAAFSALEEFDKRRDAGDPSANGKGGYWTRRKLNDNVKTELAKRAVLIKQLDDYKGRVAQVETEAEQALRHILGDNKELVADEGSLLRYKIQERDLTAQTADEARKNANAINDAADATNKLKQATDDIGKTAKPIEKPREQIGKTVRPGAQNGLKKASDEAKKTAEEFADLQTRVNTALNFDKANTDIASLVKHLLELQQAQKAIEKAGMPTQYHEAYNQIYAEIDRTKQAITAYKQSMNGVEEAHKRVEKSGVRSGSRVAQAFNNLKKVGAGVGKLINSIKSGFRSLSKHTDKVRSSFNGMSRDMRSNFKHLIRNITKYVFGFRSLFFLVRRLRKYLVEGIQNIVKYESAIGQSKRFDSTNQALNRLRTSLLFLQNAWAAAFQPVIMIGAKILSPFIDMLARAGNAVARFLGVLTGQKTVYQAVKTPAKDYAKSLKDSGSGAGKAAKKQKELNDRIAEFDDLILLGRDKDPNNGNGTGGGSGNNDDDYDYSKMFKKAKAVSSLAEMIKKAWQTADFTSVGEYIRDKIVGALEGIKWDEVKTTAFKVGKSLATLLNGVFADPKLWESVGKSFGEAINTLSQAVSGFLKNMKVDWGGNLAKLINKALKTIDWATIKSNIKLFAQQLSANIVSFFNNLDWDEIKKACQNIGESIRIFIDNTFKNPELLTSIGTGIGEFVNSVSELIAGLLSEPEKGGLLSELDDNKANSIGEGIATFLISALKKINWRLIAKNFEGALSAIFTGISDFFETAEGNGVLDDIIEAFSKINWLDLAQKGINAALKVGKGITAIAATISNAISDAIINADPEEVENAVTNFVSSINWEDIGETLSMTIGAIVKSLLASGRLTLLVGNVCAGIWQAFKEATPEIDWGAIGEMIITGLLNGMASILTNIVGWIAEKIFGPIRDGIFTNFDMGSPSKVAEQWGVWIIEGLLNGITSLVENVTKKFTEIKNNMVNAFTNAKNTVVSIVTTLVNNVGLMWDNMLFSASTKLTLIKNKIIEIWEKVQEGIKTPINGIIGIVESLINKMISGINAITKKLNSLPSLEFKNPFTGKDYSLGFKIPELSKITIPRLAQGAVIPPNRESLMARILRPRLIRLSKQSQKLWVTTVMQK